MSPLLLLLAIASPGDVRLEIDEACLAGVPLPLVVEVRREDGRTDGDYDGPIRIEGAEILEPETAGGVVQARDGVARCTIRIPSAGRTTLRARTEDGRSGELAPLALPGFLSVVPPLLAIAVAIAFRQVVVALVLGILAGSLFASGLDPVRMLLGVTDTYLLDALADRDHAAILIFSLLLGGMVGVMSRAGGTEGIVARLRRFARTRRSGQLSTAALGTAVFFDDYANCLIVGNTMRPLTDRLGISREKLAYIVDSTAAPVASLIPLSTWVGYQVGLVGDALGRLEGADGLSAYPLVVQAIPYMYYPIFALLLVYVVAWLDRDLFAMARAERRAALEGKPLADGARPLAGGEEERALAAKEGIPLRARNALLPILAVVAVTLLGLWATGRGALQGREGLGLVATVRVVLEEADSYRALLWASVTGATTAVLLAVSQRLLGLAEAADALVSGMKSMFLAAVILVLAWSLGAVTTELHADHYLAGLLHGAFDARFLPLLTFVVGAVTSLSTGTAWGTMGILVPLAVPLSYGLATAQGLPGPEVHSILLGCIASVLGGAVFGDHCSPISDTTVLSSMAAACDHVDHVRTQMPYAVLAAAVAVTAGYLPEAFDVRPAVALPLGALFLVLVVRFFGRRVAPVDTTPPARRPPCGAQGATKPKTLPR